MENNKEGHFSLMSDEDFEKSVREEAERFERDLSSAMAKINKAQARTTRKPTVLGTHVSSEKEDKPIGMKFHKFYSKVLTPLRMSLGFLGAFLLLNGSSPWPFFVGYFALAFIAIKVFVSFKDNEPYAWHFVMLYELLTIALLVYQAAYYYPFLGVQAIYQPAASILIESAIIFYYAKRKSALVPQEYSNKVMETIGLPSKEIQKPEEQSAAEIQEEVQEGVREDVKEEEEEVFPREIPNLEEAPPVVSSLADTNPYKATTDRYIEQTTSEELRKCPRCGALLPPFAAYCPGCGKKYRVDGTSGIGNIRLPNISKKAKIIVAVILVTLICLLALAFLAEFYVYNSPSAHNFHVLSCNEVKTPKLYLRRNLIYLSRRGVPPCDKCLWWLAPIW